MDPYGSRDPEERRHHFHHHPPPPPPPEDDSPHSSGHGLHRVPLHHLPPSEASPYPPQFPTPYPHKGPDYQPSYEDESSLRPVVPDLPQGQLVRVFCKASPSFNLAVGRNGVAMVQADSQDEAQQWVKDDSYGMRVKDNYGHAAFALVNKATKQIIKHSKEKGQQVLLIDYRQNIRDDDILWTESQDFGEGFKTVRSASDTLLNMTVFDGNKKIRNGSAIVLDTWHKGDHQLWKLFPL